MYAVDDRMINLVDLPILKLDGGIPISFRMFGKDQAAGSFLVQPVADLSPGIFLFSKVEDVLASCLSSKVGRYGGLLITM